LSVVHAAVLSSPAIIGHFCDVRGQNGFLNPLTLSHQGLHRAKSDNDFSGGMPLCHRRTQLPTAGWLSIRRNAKICSRFATREEQEHRDVVLNHAGSDRTP
jgi:hypothetical protein